MDESTDETDATAPIWALNFLPSFVGDNNDRNDTQTHREGIAVRQF
jgi:hypothetical protein